MATLPENYIDRVTYKNKNSDQELIASLLKAPGTLSGVINYNDIVSLAANLYNISSTLSAADTTYSYRLLFQVNESSLMPASTDSSSIEISAKDINTRAFNPFGNIYYYNSTTTVSASEQYAANTLYSKYGAVQLGYSFATGEALTMTAYRAVYLKCTPQSNGMVKLNSEESYVQTLPSTDDGFVYIYLGIASSATQIELQLNHPVYYYRNNALRLWTGPN